MYLPTNFRKYISFANNNRITITNKIEYSIYIYGAPERAVFPKIYSEFI